MTLLNNSSRDKGLKDYRKSLPPECCHLLSGYTGPWISPQTKALPFTLRQCRLKGPQEKAIHGQRQPLTHSDFPNSLACFSQDGSHPLLNTGWQLGGAQMLCVKQTRTITATAAETGGLCKTGCIYWVYLPTTGQCFPPCVQTPLGCQSTDSGNQHRLWAS